MDWTDDQKDAIYKDKTNIIVSAGAGSGKTAVLTTRVLEKLKNGVSLKNLVILTFTNLAASEMKERISKKIQEEQDNYPHLKEEIEYIDQAIITTFDSFALFLVKKYSNILNVDRNVSIADKIVLDIKLDKIIDEIFEKKYETEDPNFIKLINDYTVKDDVKLKNEIKEFYRSINNKYDKYNYLDTYMENYYNNEKIDNDIQEYVNLIIKEIDNIKNNLYKLNNILKEEKELEYLEKLNAHFQGLITLKKYEDIKEEIFSMPSIPRIIKDAKEELVKAKDNMKKSIDKIKSMCCFEDINQMKSEILDTKEYTQEIIEILKYSYLKMDEYKKQNNLYEFIDIATLGINLLKNNEQIRLELRNNINEIMIDEYQDTNDIQDIFISLISNNNVYMVGDVKQSIYRFRNANPNIFMKKYRDYQNKIDGIKIDLINNFRSNKQVISNINDIFEHVMDENIGGASYKESHKLEFGNKGYLIPSNEDYNLSIYTYESNGKKKNEIEAFIVARDIQNKINNHYQICDLKSKKLRDVTYSDFAILIDRSSQFDLYKKIFEYLHIPLCIHKNDSFIHSDEMYTILNILRIIYCYKDKTYSNDYFKHNLISLLRSFLFDYNDDEITSFMLKNNVIEEIKNENCIFNNIYKITKNISDNIEFMTLDEILNEIYEEFNIKQKVSKLGNYNNIITKLNFLLNKSKELSTIGYNLQDFILYIENVIDDEDKDIEFKTNDISDNSVSIMTIHASKGLEFNICYFPELYREFSKNDIQKQFLYSKKYGIVIPHVKDYFVNNTIYMEQVKEDYKKEEISERLRLLYVALTRAKQKMIMLIPDYYDESNTVEEIVPTDIRMKYNSFRAIILSVQNILNKYVSEITDIEVDNSYKDLAKIKKLDINEKENIEYIDINIKSEEIKEDSFSNKVHKLQDKKTKDNMEYGTKVHKYLELMDINETEISNQFKQKLTSIGINLDNSKKYNEYEFMYEDNTEIKHGIIDLLIEYNKKMYIIDYKLKDIDETKYKDQLQGYKNYITKKTNKEVECYLYSILDSTLQKIL